jgi:hypothetical protein
VAAAATATPQEPAVRLTPSAPWAQRSTEQATFDSPINTFGKAHEIDRTTEWNLRKHFRGPRTDQRDPPSPFWFY